MVVDTDRLDLGREQAVRPGTDADEMIKRKEKMARERMGQEFERMRREQQRLEEVRPPPHADPPTNPASRDFLALLHLKLEILNLQS